ncbi:hypothetical protein BAY59_27340 [Prauserella coralliicola]|nr:hypothetical protein BAY59_27340 [Prauserella coralliicola]
MTMSLSESLRQLRDKHGAERTCAENVYEVLKQAILNGQLKPGQIISQNVLYQELDVSRTPLREAIRMLQAEGWIRSEPNKRVRVGPVSANDVEQYYSIRIALESVGVGIATPQMTEDDFAELRDLLEQMRVAVDAHDYQAWEAPHRAFHEALTRRAGDIVNRMCQTLSESTTRYINLFMSHLPGAYIQGEADHAAIYEACVARDSVAATSLMAKHLARTAIQMLAVLDPGRDPAPIRMAINLVGDPAIDSLSQNKGV